MLNQGIYKYGILAILGEYILGERSMGGGGVGGGGGVVMESIASTGALSMKIHIVYIPIYRRFP